MKDNRFDKSAGAPEDEERKRLPPPSRWSSVMDELFEEAIRDGVFDNLPGQGKPLKLSRNPYAADYELAYQLLKDNDYTLPWISARNEVMIQVDQFRSELQKVWSRHRSEFQQTRSDVVRMSLALSWDRYLVQSRARIAELNRFITDVNLRQPGKQLEILKLTLRRELARAGACEELRQDSNRQ